jgi:hypothetical protein
VADGWCCFVLREKYCWLVAGGWFVLREKYCWLVADKLSEQAAYFFKKKRERSACAQHASARSSCGAGFAKGTINGCRQFASYNMYTSVIDSFVDQSSNRCAIVFILWVPAP